MVSGLSFLGLGVQAPTPEWGMMLSEAKDAMLIHPYQMLPSGIAIMVMAVSFSFLGDSIRDAMDVKHEGYALKKNRFKRKRLAA
jgi:nickel transport system permease protein